MKPKGIYYLAILPQAVSHVSVLGLIEATLDNIADHLGVTCPIMIGAAAVSQFLADKQAIETKLGFVMGIRAHNGNRSEAMESAVREIGLKGQTSEDFRSVYQEQDFTREPTISVGPYPKVLSINLSPGRGPGPVKTLVLASQDTGEMIGFLQGRDDQNLLLFTGKYSGDALQCADIYSDPKIIASIISRSNIYPDASPRISISFTSSKSGPGFMSILSSEKYTSAMSYKEHCEALGMSASDMMSNPLPDLVNALGCYITRADLVEEDAYVGTSEIEPFAMEAITSRASDTILRSSTTPLITGTEKAICATHLPTSIMGAVDALDQQPYKPINPDDANLVKVFIHIPDNPLLRLKMGAHCRAEGYRIVLTPTAADHVLAVSESVARTMMDAYPNIQDYFLPSSKVT